MKVKDLFTEPEYTQLEKWRKQMLASRNPIKVYCLKRKMERKIDLIEWEYENGLRNQ